MDADKLSTALAMFHATVMIQTPEWRAFYQSDWELENYLVVRNTLLYFLLTPQFRLRMSSSR